MNAMNVTPTIICLMIFHVFLHVQHIKAILILHTMELNFVKVKKKKIFFFFEEINLKKKKIINIS